MTLPYKQHDGLALAKMLQINKSLKRLSLSKISDISLGVSYIISLKVFDRIPLWFT